MTAIPSAPVQQLLDRLEGVSPAGRRWMAFCPAHPNRNTQALTVGMDQQGNAVVKCWSVGCSTRDIVQAVGLEVRDLFDGERSPGYVPPPPPPRPEWAKASAKPARRLGRLVKAYDYVDLDGELRFQVCRFEPKDFAQRQPCNNPGVCGYKTRSGNPCRGWHYNLDGVTMFLYRPSGIVRAVEESRRIYLVEGEKDADSIHMASDGMIAATTAPGGASEGKGKWRPAYTEMLRGAHVVYLPDNDRAGQGQAAVTCADLVGVAASVRILDLPNLPPKGDVTDWLEAGGEVTKLDELVTKRSRIVKPATTWSIAKRWKEDHAIRE